MKKLFKRIPSKEMEKPELKLFSSVVPKSFEEKFPVWEKEKASRNLKFINA